MYKNQTKNKNTATVTEHYTTVQGYCLQLRVVVRGRVWVFNQLVQYPPLLPHLGIRVLAYSRVGVLCNSYCWHQIVQYRMYRRFKSQSIIIVVYIYDFNHTVTVYLFKMSNQKMSWFI